MSHGRKRKAEHQTRAGLQERRMSRNLDKLAQFELFDKNIMPQLKKMVLENWPPEKIRKAFAPIMQAQMIKAGLQGNLTAIKDTLDRHEGMAVQRVNNVNVYARMDKRELAALALQKLLDAKIIDSTGQVIDDEEDK
jgi:hypothetical protein